MRLAPALGLSVLALMGTSMLFGAHAQAPRAASASLSFQGLTQGDDQWGLIENYCVDCHSGDSPVAGLSFDDLTPESMPQHADVWEKVIRKLRGNMMPPVGAAQPDPAERQAFIDWSSDYLDFAAAQAPDPGRVALHRLNRREYGNAIRDMLGLEINPATLLPQDDAADGFDNLADVLQVSPVFLDQYISAARSIAIQATDSRTTPVALRPPAGTNQGYYVDGLPLGTRGGFSVEHDFPLDGEYDVAFLGAGTDTDRFLALVDGVVIYDSAKGSLEQQGLKAPPAAPAAAPAAGGRGGAAPTPPAGAAAGRGGGGGAAARRTVIRLPLTAGKHTIAATYVARGAPSTATLAFLQPLGAGGAAAAVSGQAVTGADVTGPVGYTGPALTPSRRAIFICQPTGAADEAACAKRILANLARKAFRRPVTDADLDAPMRFFEDGRARDGFEAGVQQGIMAILVSPKFLYRTSEPPANARPGQIYAVSDIELASRLSFFIWSSIPDDELLQLAEQRRLSQPAVLEAQVMRMLADPRAKELVANFAFQWLHVRALDTAAPDPAIFPEFDETLRTAMREEMRLFLESVLLEDRPVTDLLDANYTFVNERLARHYGIPNIVGNGFRRVSLTPDSPRAGLLGKGSILTVTSYPDRTAPVLRGAWVLENILGTPPDAPPPGAGALEDTPENASLSIRVRMEHHRQNPSCNSCHSLMDPLGMSLDNFDAVGAWRTKDRLAGVPIDASGELPGGVQLGGPAQLRVALTAKPEYFVEALTEKLLIFGLGRGLDYHDMATVREIVRGSEEDGYRFSSLVMRVVQSQPFRMSKTPEAAQPSAQIASR